MHACMCACACFKGRRRLPLLLPHPPHPPSPCARQDQLQDAGPRRSARRFCRLHRHGRGAGKRRAGRTRGVTRRTCTLALPPLHTHARSAHAQVNTLYAYLPIPVLTEAVRRVARDGESVGGGSSVARTPPPTFPRHPPACLPCQQGSCGTACAQRLGSPPSSDAQAMGGLLRRATPTPHPARPRCLPACVSAVLTEGESVWCRQGERGGEGEGGGGSALNGASRAGRGEGIKCGGGDAEAAPCLALLGRHCARAPATPRSLRGCPAWRRPGRGAPPPPPP